MQTTYLFILLFGLFSSRSKEAESKLNWEKITDTNRVDALIASDTPVLFFKNSSRCGISVSALSRLEEEWNIPEGDCHLAFIDVLQDRSISNYLSEKTGIHHHSPQAILMINGKVAYEKTHGRIRAKDIEEVMG